MRWVQRLAILGLLGLVASVLLMFKLSSPTLLLPWWVIFLFVWIWCGLWAYHIVSQIRQRHLSITGRLKMAPIPLIAIILHFIAWACIVSFSIMLVLELTFPGYFDMRVLFIPLFVFFTAFTLGPIISLLIESRHHTLMDGRAGVYSTLGRFMAPDNLSEYDQ